VPLPTWAPTLPDVANYVPRRTVVGAADGYGAPVNTFDTTTHPTAAIATGLITDACNWVLAKTGPVDASLTGMALATAAVRTAGMVELTYPDNRDDLSTAETLLRQADEMRTDLAAANEAVTGGNPEDPQAHLMPVYSFPPPGPWAADFDL
jgi:hypothetical protein